MINKTTLPHDEAMWLKYHRSIAWDSAAFREARTRLLGYRLSKLLTLPFGAIRRPERTRQGQSDVTWVCGPAAIRG